MNIGKILGYFWGILVFIPPIISSYPTKVKNVLKNNFIRLFKLVNFNNCIKRVFKVFFCICGI